MLALSRWSQSMGRRLERVPAGFVHPKDSNSAFVPGAHLELLYSLAPDEKPWFQVYEDVSEGTPVSPAFASETALRQWLSAHGVSEQAIDEFVRVGFAPLLVVSPHGVVRDGIEGLVSRD
jgi:hypothetical protein